MKNDKEVVVAAVQNKGSALRYAAEETKKELAEEANSHGVSIQEYCVIAIKPKIIQVFLAEGNNPNGYAAALLKISCRDLKGDEVMTFVSEAKEDNAKELRSELAKVTGVHPAALCIINQRGEQLRVYPDTELMEFVQ